MAVRQYIGARYVTKIYENSLDQSSAEWEANVNYEPLVMVTYNNGSYLSKKEVPANIGDPASNPSYWVQTGFYNGQISYLQNEIDELKAYNTPQMFGAKGDGVTDDTQALQDAIDASYDAMLIIPQGIYKISSPLVINRSITIVGAMTSARTYNTSGGFVDNITSYITTDVTIDCIINIKSSFVTLKNLALKCNNASGAGVKTTDTAYSRLNLENVHVSEATDKGFVLHCYLSTVKLCTTYRCTNYGFYFKDANVGMTSLTVENCFANYSDVGYYLYKYEYSTLISCAADSVSDSYVFESCRSLDVIECGTENCDNPMQLIGANNVNISGFCAEGLTLTNGVNDNGAVIYVSSVANNVRISGLYMTQVNDYKGYKLYFADGTIMNGVVIGDQSIVYAEIRTPSGIINKANISFPNHRSLLNGIMTLASSTVDECSCDKIDEGNYIITVDTVDSSADYCVFPLCSFSLEAGTYLIKGTPIVGASSNFGITVGNSNYGYGEIAWDKGGTPVSFTVNSTTTVYVAIIMKPNASRSFRFVPELIKID